MGYAAERKTGTWKKNNNNITAIGFASSSSTKLGAFNASTINDGGSGQTTYTTDRNHLATVSRISITRIIFDDIYSKLTSIKCLYFSGKRVKRSGRTTVLKMAVGGHRTGTLVLTSALNYTETHDYTSETATDKTICIENNYD